MPVDVLLGVSYLDPMHLTDAAYVVSLPGFEGDTHEDPRGDDGRPSKAVGHGPPATPGAEALQALDRAAAITGASEQVLRTDAVHWLRR